MRAELLTVAIMPIPGPVDCLSEDPVGGCASRSLGLGRADATLTSRKRRPWRLGEARVSSRASSHDVLDHLDAVRADVMAWEKRTRDTALRRTERADIDADIA